VARQAGVSIATVSRALTGSKRVSPDLADRVREAAGRLGYRPNPAAQVLLSGRSHTVGVVVPDLGNPYFAEMLKGATPRAAEQGWQTLVADADEDPEEEYRGAMELAHHVDGLILCAPRMATSRMREVARAAPALVVVNRSVRIPSVATVLVDYHSAMRQLLDHLASLGHRRVVYLSGPPGAWSDTQRRRALERSRESGMEVLVLPCGSAADDGHRSAETVLAQRSTAVMAFNDNVALGLLNRLYELGVQVPDELSVAGFDDIPLSGLLHPGLTTVRVPKHAVGRLAWERLSLGPSPETVPRSSSVPVELVARGTTAAVAGGFVEGPQ
jgi:LacI family transcriptional regulator